MIGEKNMHGIKLFLAAALLGATLAASAQTPQIDTAHEIEAHTITLPKSDTGTVVVQGCSACPTFRFVATDHTEYQVGPTMVSIREMRDEIAARPNDVVLLIISDDRRVISKIAIPAAR